MQYIKQFGILALAGATGEAISRLVFAGRISGNVIGMLLLFLLLCLGVVKLGQIEDTADFILKNMSFFFIPATVSFINAYDLIKNVLVQLFLIAILTSILTFFVTYHTVRLVYLIQEKIGGNRRA
jgi:holin-like protein